MNNKNTLYGILTILFANPAYAALDCKVQPTCAELGYSKEVSGDCSDYVLCPFDTSYKKCLTTTSEPIDCSNYNLTICPPNGVCVSCNDGGTTKYALAGCKSGYFEDKGISCQKAYASCEAAGYFSDDTNRNCSDENWIFLTNGNVKTCLTSCECIDGYAEDEDGVCVKAYESCEAAGYFTSDENRSCDQSSSSQMVTIYDFKGQVLSCYTGCSCDHTAIDVGWANDLYLSTTCLYLPEEDAKEIVRWHKNCGLACQDEPGCTPDECIEDAVLPICRDFCDRTCGSNDSFCDAGLCFINCVDLNL